MVKLRLEGDRRELTEKAPDIVKAVVERLPGSPLNDEILEILEKAVRPTKEQELKHPALRELHRRANDIIQARYAIMLKEIGAVLDQDPNETKKAYDHSKRYYDADARKYDDVKEALKEHGYSLMDFERGGELYGWSVNQLVELWRQLQKMEKKADPQKALES